MRALLAALAICVGWVGSVHARWPDQALTGTWAGTGQVATAQMAKTGAFILHIDAGTYFQVFHGPADFVVDWGEIYADGFEYWRKTSNGLEDRGGYARIGDGFRFTGAWSRFRLQQTTDAQKTAAYRRVAALLRAPPTRTTEDWTMRATALAALWQPDAALENTTLDKPTAANELGPLSSLTLRFRSAASDRRLVLRSTPAGTFDSFLVPP